MVMKCKICGSDELKTIYKGQIRDGRLGKYTADDIQMFQCEKCDVIWHDPTSKVDSYYESSAYRSTMGEESDAEEFFKIHDYENLQKFMYTGTSIFRNRTVADIGCGCGGFLDFLSGVAHKIVAIEPSEKYQYYMKNNRAYDVYSYAKNAINDGYENTVDVVTSFDVIEHVEDPKEFAKDVYRLLASDGVGIIGTPTDAPVMRELLGEVYEKKQLFSTQHLWIFSKENMELIFKEAGFEDIKIKYYQRYSIGNMLGWIRDKKPNSGIDSKKVFDSIVDYTWRASLQEKGLADYIVAYVRK